MSWGWLDVEQVAYGTFMVSLGIGFAKWVLKLEKPKPRPLQLETSETYAEHVSSELRQIREGFAELRKDITRTNELIHMELAHTNKRLTAIEEQKINVALDNLTFALADSICFVPVGEANKLKAKRKTKGGRR
jgi:hypothetical protein